MTSVSPDVRARVWLTDGPKAVYPEQTPQVAISPRSTGVCFSGGGTRSYTATVGQLRGLTAAGLIGQVGYLSAVSGGAWAAAPYTYYPAGSPSGDGVASDVDILGIHLDPEGLSMEALSQLEPQSLGFAATGDFSQALTQAREDPRVDQDDVWTRAVGRTFLSPYDLYDPDHPVSFTLSDSTAAEIRDRHPSLQGLRLHTVRDAAYRPYLIVHSALNWPGDESDLTRVNLVGFEYSPLGVGSAARVTLQSDRHPPHIVGGGFVEPFAFGSDRAQSTPDADGLVTLTLPPEPFTLADAIGASSAFSTAERDLRMYPHARYWPPGGAGRPACSEVFTDGGDIENYGLISLLRRQVKAVVVFINSMWPVSLDHDPSNGPRDLDDSPPVRREVDPFLAPLFGAPSAQFPHNRVFPEADYAMVVRGLQAAKRRGETVMTISHHLVQSNPWWGIEGGSEVSVCWCYNEQVDYWERRLPDGLRRLVHEGRAPQPVGPFAHFPHYRTRAQNPGTLVKLTSAQVNLLAHLSCWNVVQKRDALREFFDRA